MKRARILAALACLFLVFSLGACTRNIFDDLGQKGQVLLRDSNHSYDMASKLFLNHDPDDPYLD
ncbi:MAG TPA: hypothetical protein VGC54_04440 [Planctomycetota bacterium]